MGFLEKTVNWANYADSQDKVYLIKSILNLMGNDELACVKSILQRRRRRKQEDCRNRTWKGPRAPASTVQRPDDARSRSPPKSVRNPAEAVTTPDEAEKCYKNFQVADVIAFDVEAVPRYAKYLDDHFNLPEEEPAPQREILHGQRRKFPKRQNLRNGIRFRNDLQRGSSFHIVQDRFVNAFKKKLHVTCGGGNNYRFLEVAGGEFDNFDLQSFYKRPCDTNSVGSPMSLRDIYFYHFKDDIQRGNHDAHTDAKATLRIFFEGYLKIQNKSINFEKAENLNKLEEKQSILWCRTLNQFGPRCEHEKCGLPVTFN